MSRRRPKSIVCDRCDHAATDFDRIGNDWLCRTCIDRADDHTRWCGCGLMLAGSTRQVVAMAEVHWRRGVCSWRLYVADPTVTADPEEVLA